MNVLSSFAQDRVQELLFTEAYYQEIAGSFEEIRSKKPAAFSSASSIFLDQLARSNMMLYQGEVHDYVQSLFQQLLPYIPSELHQTQVWVIRSPEFNAFSLPEGIVLIPLGLIARLENEDQLLFILSHEIGHLKAEHHKHKPEHLYKDRQDTQPEKQSILPGHNFHFKQEWEADSIGWSIYKQLGRPVMAAIDALETSSIQEPILSGNSWQLSDWLPEGFHLSKTYLSTDEDTSLSLAVVAPVAERLKKIYQLFPELESVNASTPSPLPKYIHQRTQIETCYLYLLQNQYEAALIWADYLTKTGCDQRLLKEMGAFALYALAKYTNAGKRWNVYQNIASFTFGNHKLHDLLDQISARDLNMWALRYNWQLKDTSDLTREAIIHDLINDWIKYHQGNPGSLNSSPDLFVDASIPPYPGSDLEFLEAAFRYNKEQSRRKRFDSTKSRDHIVFVDPYYYRLDQRKGKAHTIHLQQNAQNQFVKTLQNQATSLERDYSILDQDNTGKIDSRLILLREWVAFHSPEQDVNLISFHHEAVQPLVDMFQTSCFVWMGGVATTQLRHERNFMLIAGILLPPVLPLSLYYVLTPKHQTLFYTLIYDLKTGQRKQSFTRQVKMKDREDVINATVYDLVSQIPK